MSTCSGKSVNGVGGALNSSEKTQTRQGIAIYEDKKTETNLKFTSYTEKYAYMKGKTVCAPCPSEEPL